MPINFADLNSQRVPYREQALEDIVDVLRLIEKDRRDDSTVPYEERAVTVSYRTTISGLETSLERLRQADALGCGTQITTRCMAHQFVDWYQNLDPMYDILKKYGSLVVQADDLGMDDVGRWIKHTESFQLISSAATTVQSRTNSFSIVGKLKSAIHSMAVATGIDEYKLVSIGIAWSISTNTKMWSLGSIKQHFQPEIDHLIRHLEERLMYLQFCEKVMSTRLSRQP